MNQMNWIKGNDHVEVILENIERFQKATYPKYELDGNGLTIADVAIIARHDFSERNIEVTISDETRVKLEENAAYLSECLAKKWTIYGVNTGYGGSADVTNNDAASIGKVLLVFLNCGSKTKCLDIGWVRASMFTRANSLSRAASGVRPDVVELLCHMINADIVPEVPLRGSISASGDLVPLSYIASCMSGVKRNSPVYFKGELHPTAESAFKIAGLSFIKFQPKEILSIINSASCSAVLGAINLFDFGAGILLTELVTALTLESLKGRMESFHPEVHRCLPHGGLKQFSRSIQLLLEESKFVRREEAPKCGELCQDRYALRTSPQWVGPCIETFMDSVRRIQVELNSTNDNPIIDHVGKSIINCGNFQGSYVVVAMDQTRQSVQMCGRMMFAQLSEVLNQHMNGGLPPNLSGSDHTLDFGFKGLDIALASYASELDSLSTPMTGHVLSAEMHNQSINSLALISARKTSEALELLQLIISSSLLCLCQAVDLRWLQGEVSRIWRVTGEELSMDVPLEGHGWTWYDVAFRYDEVSLEMKKSFKRLLSNKHNENGAIGSFLLRLKEKISSRLNLLEGGLHVGEVSKNLGLGTRQFYRFIRENLEIKFHNGTKPVDDSLEKIVGAIRDRTILNVIVDVFSC